MDIASRFRSQAARFTCKRVTVCLYAWATLLLYSPPALAGQVHESDLSVSSQVGKVRTQAEGQNSEARGIVHSVDIRPDARTGDVNVSGKAERVHTQAGGQNTSAASAVGGVAVGGK
jgi:hypothetical protein